MTVDHGGGGAERHAELSLEAGGRVLVQENRRRDRVDADVNPLDISGVEAVAAFQIQQRVERRVRRGARGIQLDGDARIEDLPAPAEIGDKGKERGRFTVHGGEEPLRSFDRRTTRGHARLREQRRQHAVARREAGVERLHHRSEVFLEARRFGRGNGQGVADDPGAESEKARCRGRGTNRAQRGRAVPSAPVVAGIHRTPQTRFDFEAHHVRLEQRPPCCAGQFRDGKARSDERRAGMGKRDEAHVVVIVRVRRGAVRQRGVGRARAQPRSEHRALEAGRLLRHDLLHRCRGRLGRAGQHDADRVEESPGGSVAALDGRDRARDELGERHRPSVAASGLPMAAMNRCLRNTQSVAGLPAGPDSATLATMRRDAARAALKSLAVRACVTAEMPIAVAAAARSAPCAVGVC